MEQARSCLDEAVEIFEKAENMDKLKEKVTEINNKFADPMERQMHLMMGLVPMAQEMLKELMAKYGFDQNNFMMGVMQIQMNAMMDEQMKPKAEKLMRALKGDFS